MFKRLRRYWEQQKVFREIGSFDESGLVYAAEEGNLECLAILIKAGYNVNALSERGVPAISRAVEKGNLPVIRMLVEAGADINAKDQQGVTPLMRAIKSSNRHIFTYLMEHNPDLELHDEMGETALFKAVREGNTTLTRKFIEAGAEVDIINREGHTALMYAVEHERIGIVKLLLAADADPNVRDKEGHTVLEYNVQSPRLTRMLRQASLSHRQEYAAQNSPPKTPPRPQPFASLNANLRDQFPKLSETMLGLMDVTLQALNSPYRVDDAAEKGRQLIHALLAVPASSPNGQAKASANGHVPVVDAAVITQQLQELMNWLHTQKAQADKISSHTQAQLDQALLEAAQLGAHEIVPLLLGIGADHDARDDAGNASLHLAVAHPAVVKQLLDDGADSGARNQAGETPVDLAKRGKYVATLEMLPPSPPSSSS